MAVPVLGGIVLVVLAFPDLREQRSHLPLADTRMATRILEFKSPFLNAGFVSIASVITVGLWSWLTVKLRSMSLAEDKMQLDA